MNLLVTAFTFVSNFNHNIYIYIYLLYVQIIVNKCIKKELKNVKTPQYYFHGSFGHAMKPDEGITHVMKVMLLKHSPSPNIFFNE